MDKLIGSLVLFGVLAVGSVFAVLGMADLQITWLMSKPTPNRNGRPMVSQFRGMTVIILVAALESMGARRSGIISRRFQTMV